MPLADARTARVLITVLLFALGLGFLYVARQTLIAFLFAIFFAYLMSPLVSHLEKLLRGRGLRHRSNLSAAAGPAGAAFHFHGTADRPGRRAPEPVAPGSGTTEFRADRGTTGRRAWLELPDASNCSATISPATAMKSRNWRRTSGLRVADVAKQAWLLVVVPLLSIFFLKDGRAFSEFLLDSGAIAAAA